MSAVVQKRRSKWLTGWIVFILIVNAITALYYLVADFSDSLSPDQTKAYALLAFAVVLCMWQILCWRKWGLYAYAALSLGVAFWSLTSGASLLTTMAGVLNLIILTFFLSKCWAFMK